MTTTNLTPEGKQRLLMTRDELYDAYLDARTRLDRWHIEGRQLRSTDSNFDQNNKKFRRRDLLAYLERHLHDLSAQLRTIDTLISPPQVHDHTPCN